MHCYFINTNQIFKLISISAVLLMTLLFVNPSYAKTILIKQNQTIRSIIDDARIVKGGTLHLHGVANGNIIIEQGGTLYLQGVVNGTISNEGGNLFIHGFCNSLLAKKGYTEISGTVTTLTKYKSAKILIKPGSSISGKKY